MKGDIESDSISVNSISDYLSSQNNDLKSAHNQTNEIDIDFIAEEDKLLEGFSYKLSEKLSNAQVDSYFKPIKSIAKSTNTLCTTSKLQLDNLGSTQKNEELRLNLGKESHFILDESKRFYRKKEEADAQQNASMSQMKPVRFNTCNLINNNSGIDRFNKENEVEQSKHIKINCQKIIFEYENSDSEDNDCSSTTLPSFDVNSKREA